MTGEELLQRKGGSIISSPWWERRKRNYYPQERICPVSWKLEPQAGVCITLWFVQGEKECISASLFP